MPEDAFQSLTGLGFTELEAEVYVALLQESPATGYRVAQSLGRPVANTYKAIESLQHKGAVLVDQGSSRLCRAVPAEELLAQLDRTFQRRRQEAAHALASLRAAPEDDRVYQLQSVDQVFERCRRMLEACEQVAVLDVFPKPLEELRDAMEAAASRGVRLVVKAYAPATIRGADVAVHPLGRMSLRRWPGHWLNVVTDGREHLLAFLTPDARGLHQAIWSGSAYLSWVYHSAVAAELILAALQRGLEDGATAAELRQAVAGYQYLFSSDLPAPGRFWNGSGNVARRPAPRRMLEVRALPRGLMSSIIKKGHAMRTMIGRVTFLICTGVAWLGLSGGPAVAQEKWVFPAASPESQGIPTAAVRQLAGEVDRYLKAGTIVGGELLVIKNRKTILHEAFGDRDREDKLPMVRDTIFNVRSMTKPLTGVAVQMLVDEGKIRLDDPVVKYLSGFDNDKSRAITIRQLLEHRSGLPLTILILLNAYKDLRSQAKAVGEKGPQFKPDTKFWYSDAGSDAAAAIVEHASGMKIDHFVTERILQPLGMADSFYLSKADDPRKRVASLYMGTPGKWSRFWKPGGAPMYPFAWGSQTLYSTPADYARFLTLWMDGGKVGGKQLLSKEAVARILTPTSQMTMLGADTPYPTGFDGLRIWYGQMSMLYTAGDNPAAAKLVAFGHGGSDGTAAWAFPEEDLIVCYFTQSRGQTTTIRLESTIQQALLRRSGPEVKAPDELKPFLGSYYANFGQYKQTPFQVVFRNGRLALDIPDQLVFELKDPDKDGRRQFVISEKIAVSFKKGAEGKVVSMTLYQSGLSFELPKDKLAHAERQKK